MDPDPNSECFLITIELKAFNNWKQEDSEKRTENAGKLFASILTVAFPNERTLSLPITARIVRPVTVQPNNLSYGSVDTNAAPTVEFTLSAKTDFSVLSIQVS